MNISSTATASNRRRVAATFAILGSALFWLTASRQACAQVPPAAEPPATPAQTTPVQPQGNQNSGAGRTAPVVKGSITGRVVGEGGEPLAGVPVFSFPAAPDRNFRPIQQTPAMTDDDGNFTIEGLSPGLYYVNASLRGYTRDPNDAASTGLPGGPAYRPGDSVQMRLVRGGVVTGTVTDAGGEPLVAINVRAYLVRDFEGGTAFANFSVEDQTDDRGVYRIYGLRQGVYVVVAGSDPSRFRGPGAISPYENEAPTFYPSGTRDTASEVTVRAGQETAGIDIRYRGERGRRVTGTVSVAQGQPAEAGVTVSLFYPGAGLLAGAAFVPPGAGERSFSFEGVADGEYEVQAQSTDREGNGSTSAPQRLSMSGADVTGLKLTLVPFASISGDLVVEPLAEAARAVEPCKERRSSLLPQETLVFARREETSGAATLRAGRRAGQRRDASPDRAGAFTLRNLEPGRFRVVAGPADENWYVRAVQLPAPPAPPPPKPAAKPGPARKETAAAAAPTPPARETFELQPGQRLAGLTIRVTEGAAGLSGRLAPAEEDASLPSPSQTRLHLVPAEREQADNLLRYYETAPTNDGAFSFKHLAPGKYLLLTRTVESTPPDATERPAAWDASVRTRLRREAESAKLPVELNQCQRVTGYELRTPAPTKD